MSSTGVVNPIWAKWFQILYSQVGGSTSQSFATLQTEVTTLQTQMATANGNIATLTTEVSTLNTTVTALNPLVQLQSSGPRV